LAQVSNLKSILFGSRVPAGPAFTRSCSDQAFRTSNKQAGGTIVVGFRRALLAAILALAPTQIWSAPADDAAAVFSRWKAAYDANDNVAVAKLYTTNAILHGTRSNNVTLGREAITKYFTVVVNTGNKVEFREREIMVLSDSTVLAVGFNDFMRNVGGKLNPEPARFTILLVKQGSEWLIAHHHSSLRPPPPTPK
jgi:uncharacterized protein (TIGR02246 family)